MKDFIKDKLLEDLLKQIEHCFIADSIIVEIPLNDPQIKVVILIKEFYHNLNKLNERERTNYEERLHDIEEYWNYPNNKSKGIRGLSNPPFYSK